MAIISLADANAWADGSKLNITVLDVALEAAQTAEVFARLSNVYAVSGWTSSANTPDLVRKIIAMLYMGWFYQRTYSDDEATNSYGLMLIAQAERLLDGLEDGTLTIDGAAPSTSAGILSTATFYPTDASSAVPPTFDDSSLGDAKFTMGTIW
jgi:hypothetical protein